MPALPLLGEGHYEKEVIDIRIAWWEARMVPSLAITERSGHLYFLGWIIKAFTMALPLRDGGARGLCVTRLLTM